MYSIMSYRDLILEIEMSKTRIQTIEEQKEQLLKLMYAFTGSPKELKAMVYSDMPKGGVAVEYERLVEGMNRLENILEIENRILLSLEVSEQNLNDKLKRLEGIDYKVAYLIQVKEMSLQEIADELGYSLGYIKNISASIKKERV